MSLFGILTATQPHFGYNYFEYILYKDIKFVKVIFFLKKLYGRSIERVKVIFCSL